MYVRPTIEDQPVEFGVSGKLWRNALIMYDRATLSLWSQVTGGAVAGPLTGNDLETLPAQLTTWSNWLARYPATLVLAKPKQEKAPYSLYFKSRGWVGPFGSKYRDKRLPKKELICGLSTTGRPFAVPRRTLRKKTLIQVIDGANLVILVSPPGADTALAYGIPTDGEAGVSDFSWDRDGTQHVLVDGSTGSRWSWQTGTCIAGSRRGEVLDAVPVRLMYWNVWVHYYPETEVIRE
ncbi:DUF3179 domain-containing protein [Sulfidibacter corallicola]|uniref:DUF3179 domain-containing protein n=1 Tax=Sulfidibacter corallicola TaxID=2818388 RepID=A0A8A4TQW6_SULCO|nr:DUF3179 domain-containing protein [Sulfidibacter corallicola]